MMLFILALFFIAFFIGSGLIIFGVISWSGFKRRYAVEADQASGRLQSLIIGGDSRPQEQIEFEEAVQRTRSLMDQVATSKAAFERVDLSAPGEPTNPDKVLKFVEGMGPVMVVGAEMLVREFFNEMHPTSIPDAIEKLKELGVEYINVQHHGLNAAQSIYEFTLDRFQNLLDHGHTSIGDAFNQFSGTDFSDLVGHFSTHGQSLILSGTSEALYSGLLDAGTGELAQSLFSGIVDHIPVTTIIFGVIREYKVQQNTSKSLLHSAQDIARDTGYVATGGVLGHIAGMMLDFVLPGSQTVFVILLTAAGSVIGGAKAREKRMETIRTLEERLRNQVGLMESELQELNIGLHKIWQATSKEATERFHANIASREIPALDQSSLKRICERLYLFANRDVQNAHAYVDEIEKNVYLQVAGWNPLLHALRLLGVKPTSLSFEQGIRNVRRAIEDMKQRIPNQNTIQNSPESALIQFAQMPVFIHGAFVLELNEIRRKSLNGLNETYSQSYFAWKTHAALSMVEEFNNIAESLKPHIESVERARKKWGANIRKVVLDLRQAMREANVKEDKVEQILRHIDRMFGAAPA